MSEQYYFDNPKNVKKLLTVFFAVCAVLFLLDFVIEKHPHYGWEQWPGFYAIYGFVSCVILVFIAKYILRPLVKRDEDYYD